MARSRILLVFFVLGSVVGGCSPAPAPVARATNDPSNPDAPEGAPEAVVASSASPAGRAHHEGAAVESTPHGGHAGHEGAPASGHAGHEGAPAADAVYVCPMHPDVTSKEPGTCPKCHMKLVPRK